MDVSIQSLKIFCKVVEKGSFSEAARSLKITQPTVSQQISRIEHLAGGKLFERVGKSIHLTQLGKEFYAYASDIVERTDEFTEQLHEQRLKPSGLVKYAMPESCQWTPHYRKIMSQIKDFPDIQFEISILPNDQITQLLLEGKIDFGFITGERLNPELRFERFSDEAYSLVANSKEFFNPLDKASTLSQLRLVSYPGWELFFETWARSNNLWEQLKAINPTVKVGTLAGAIHATQEGAGAAVIPTHCVAGELENKALFESTKNKYSKKPVHIVKRVGDRLPRRAELILEMLKSAKMELG